MMIVTLDDPNIPDEERTTCRIGLYESREDGAHFAVVVIVIVIVAVDCEGDARSVRLLRHPSFRRRRLSRIYCSAYCWC